MQGRKLFDGGAVEVWMKPLADGSRAVILFNRGNEGAPITVHWEDLGFFPGGTATVRDLWAKKDLGAFTGRFDGKVGAHDVAMLKITAK
jgi:alpha-galactosidase